jgi:hypothetical protein
MGIRLQYQTHVRGVITHCTEDLVDNADVVWTQTDFEGKYANCFRIGHNTLEFLIDFGQCGQGTIAILHTRIIVHPADARVFLRLLEKSLLDYTNSHDGLVF